MSIVKDMALAPTGHQKIEWVRDFMPALSGIEERFRREKPFAGLTIAVSVHLEAKTANLGLVLREGGANVVLTGCNPLSTQDDVAAAMADRGVETYGVHGVTPEEYEDLLVETLKCRPHLIVDDGGDLIALLGGRCARYGDRLIGGCEETTTGIHRLKAREKAGILPCPMMAVNDAKAKHYYDNKYGTGQSTWDAIMHTTNLMVAGKTVVVAGYGWCGKGIAMRAKGMGANVIVTEVDPFKALEATMENFRVMPMDEAAKYGDIFVTATGCKDVIVERHFAVMKDNAILCNSGHFDCEVDVARLRELAVGTEERRANIVAEVEFEDDAPAPEGGKVRRSRFFALNEVTVERGISGRIVDMDVMCDGTLAYKSRGNGMVVASATGSTAYALSAGGPLMSPEMRGLVVVPLDAHTLNSRAMVTAPGEVVELVMSGDEWHSDVRLFIDGRPLDFDVPIQRVCVHNSHMPTRILRYKHKGFYDDISRVFFRQE